MRHGIVLLAIVAATSVVGGVLAATHTSDEKTEVLEAPIVLDAGDARLQQAYDCLHVNGDEKIEQLLRVLEATGFTLRQVTLRGTRSEPDRIRFGYEFGSELLVKTVYWEADCPRSGPQIGIAAR